MLQKVSPTFRNDMDLQNTSGRPTTGSVRKSQPRRTHDVMTSFNTNGPRTRIIAQRLSVRETSSPQRSQAPWQPTDEHSHSQISPAEVGFLRVNPAVALCRSEPEAPSPHTPRAAPASPPRTANKGMVKIGGPFENALWTLAN